MTDIDLVDVQLGRVIIRDGSVLQYIYLVESDGGRGFPIVIGDHEAREIQRVLEQEEPRRPLTHSLAYNIVQALGAKLETVDIVDLRDNTFFAQITLTVPGREANGSSPDTDDALGVILVDARPSDAIALALRARCKIRAARSVIEKAATTEEEEKEGEE